MLRLLTYTCLLFLLCRFVNALAADDASVAAYLPPGTADIKHLCLIYHGQERRVAWTSETLKPYVACLDTDGKPTDWLFDSFLFIEFATDEKKSLYHYAPEAAQADGTDWAWLADGWFREETGLIGLERCVAEVGAALNEPDHKVNVVITLPVPLQQINEFSNLPETSAPLNFTIGEDRQQALEWYIRIVSEQFAAADYQHLNLVGFYWTGESIVAEQHDTIRWTADYLHERGLKFFWIPYFTAAGVEHWRDVGFDAMMLQPNYFFNGNGGINRLMLAAKRALILGSGVEMEFDGRAFTSEEHDQRYWDYLDAGVKYGWMTEALMGWYEGGGALLHMFDEGEKRRAMYEALCRFVKGDYVPKDMDRLPELVVAPPPEKGENFALASRGASVHGAIDDGQAGLAPDRMINGKSLLYTGTSGFAWFPIPGSVTVELAETVQVNRTRTLFFDLDGRHYTYRIETSVDEVYWEPAVEKSEGEWSSWQLDTFSQRDARFIRITGLSNSTGQNLCQIVEFEVYGDALQSQADSWQLSEIARGASWVSPYWGYCAPKIVCDGEAYYTVGLWGSSADASHGIIYRGQGGDWTPGAKLVDIYQPPVVLLDDMGRVIVVYTRSDKPMRVIRGKTPGSIDEYDTLPSHPDMKNAYYPGAAIHGTDLYVAFCSTPDYTMYLACLNLDTLTWSPLTVLQVGQAVDKPKTAWTYPILVPDENGVHVVASNSPDGGEGNTYNKVWYLYCRQGETVPLLREVVAESPMGCTAFATDMAVDSNGEVHVLHILNVHVYGDQLSDTATSVGTYHAKRGLDGKWQRTRIAAAGIASFADEGEERKVVLPMNGGLSLQSLLAPGESYPLVKASALPALPGFVDVISCASGSARDRGVALVFDVVPFLTENPKERILFALIQETPSR